MGEMRDSDWSRPKILRSDWLLLIGAIMTTYEEIILLQSESLRVRFLVQIRALVIQT